MAENTASFENLSTNLQFQLVHDDVKNTVSVARISSSANATTLEAIAAKFNELFDTEPTANFRSSKDQIVSE